MIRVLLVDDSPTIREYLKMIIKTDNELEVVGVAKDGLEAVEMANNIRPDVITMDIQMPRMDGYEATRKIMEVYPVPIIIISTLMVPEQVENSFRAMEAGAVAALEKPKGLGHPDSDKMASKIVQTIKLMSEVKVVRRYSKSNRHKLMETTSMSEIAEKVKKSPQSKPGKKIQLLVIGASTGGPPVIRTIFSALSNDCNCPILVVQHIAQGFLEGMVEWLKKEIPMPVHIPEDNEKALPGHIYFAPDGKNMGINMQYDILLSDSPPENGVKPSVSYLFRCAAEVFGQRSIGVLLTGMGRDGAKELKGLKDTGAVTIVQNKESSVVHGMPGEAIKLGGACHVLAPEKIGPMIQYIMRHAESP